MKNKLETKLKITISKSLKIPQKSIKLNLTASNCKNWDSLNFLTLISNLEKNFKIKFNYKEMIMLDSYKNIIKVLNSKIKE
jgi:acyl carrier protein